MYKVSLKKKTIILYCLQIPSKHSATAFVNNKNKNHKNGSKRTVNINRQKLLSKKKITEKRRRNVEMGKYTIMQKKKNSP